MSGDEQKIAFISYAHEDGGFVERALVPSVERCGYTVWRDADIEPGADFEGRITDHLRQADVFLLTMSPHSQASQWVRDELHSAFYLAKRVIPLLYRDCDPLAFHIRLPGLQSVDVRQSTDALIRALGRARDAEHVEPERASADRATAFAAIAITLLPLAELNHVRNLARANTANYHGGRPVRHEVRHLCDLGLCKRKSGHSVAELADGSVVDLAHVVELTEIGRALSGYVR